jgi:2-polyprenyl-6-methoxyphenol hydroxylase-like FAD-dependent oxidoreductase
MRIAINGAGIAGPTLAWWLRKSGHDVLLIEQSRALRSGGYAIDFWGVGYDIAEKMGLRPRITALGYEVKEMRYVDDCGRKRGGFPLDILDRITGGRYTQVRRADLAAAIYQALDGEVETIFGDSIAAVDDRGHCVRIAFEHAAAREVDLVIGADGLHSRVRELAFGPESQFEVPLGYHVAAFEVDGYPRRDELVAVSHAIPGRQVLRVSLRDDKTLFLFVFRDEYILAAHPTNEKERKAVLGSVFAGMGWECPRILAAMDQAGDIYFDRVSQIRMPRWSQGRIALVGDAAACVSLLAGEGTGLAMAEAYFLAGELENSGGDHISAFASYQERLMPLLKRKQASAAKLGSSFAPKSAWGIVLRNQASRLLQIPFLANALIGRVMRDDIELPDYGFPK